MAGQVASIEIQAKAAGLAAQLREAQAKFGKFADNVDALFDGKKSKKKRKKDGLFGDLAPSKLNTALGVAAGGMIGGAASRAAGFIEDIGESAFSFQEKLTRLQITAEATPAAMEAFGRSVEDASNKTGKSKGEILDAGAAFVALTGDMDTASKSVGTWTSIAQATGSSVGDISTAAAALSQQMNIKPDQMMETFGVLAFQGKKGAIEIKDLAAQLSSVAPKWARFGGATGQGARGVAELGAALQIAKRGFGGDAGETVTGLEGMLTAFQRHASKFGANGIKIFEKDGRTMRNVSEIVNDIAKKNLRGDLKIAMFGRTEGLAAEEQLEKFNKEYQELANTKNGAEMIGRDLDTFVSSAAGRSERAMNHLKNTIAEAFTPERIEKFASAMEHAAGAAETTFKFADFLINGRSKEGAKNEATTKFLDIQNDQGEGSAIAIANQALSMTEDEFNDHRFNSLGGGMLSNLTSTMGSFGAVQEGARAYLDSQRNARGYVANAGNPYVATTQQALYNTPAFTKRGLSEHQLAAGITKAIADGFASIQIQMDGTKVGVVTKNAAHHRRDVKK